MGVGGWLPPSPLSFLFKFFLDDKTSEHEVFSSCSFIPRAHFETSLVMVIYYGYEIVIIVIIVITIMIILSENAK